jgi:predicted DNA-binding protein
VTLKEATMSIRVEESLRDQFNEAAVRVDRPAAQIMRELMRGFVEKNLPPKQPLMTMEEYERRKAVDFVLANSELEGYKTSDEQKAVFERYAKGEITTDDIHRIIEEKFGHLRVDNR